MTEAERIADFDKAVQVFLDMAKSIPEQEYTNVMEYIASLNHRALKNKVPEDYVYQRTAIMQQMMLPF